MDVKYVNAFTDVIVNTFETSVNHKPFRYGDFQILDGDIKPDEELLCVLTLKGTLTGVLLLCVPEHTAKTVYKALVFEDVEELDEEVTGAFEEIVGMVKGNLVPLLDGHSVTFEAPVVVANQSVTYENDENLRWLIIPMAFKELGYFRIILGLKESPA